MRVQQSPSLILVFCVSFLTLCVSGFVPAADVVPTDVQMPGTQPGDAGNLQRVDRCDNCHGGYDIFAEPFHAWRGSMMSHAGADPLFWATVAIAEQDFDGAGDLCLRCHAGQGWVEGRSTPTDGSGLAAQSDGNGVECDLCHRLTNTDDSELLGEQFFPFIANDGAEGFYGSGQYSLWGSSDKLGPYFDADARHQSLGSMFHRTSELCGTCHDVSNPVTGDLAHNFGAMVPLAPGTYSGIPGDLAENKAAFHNPPYRYGVVERTFSEHKASALSALPVSAMGLLPAELQDGAILAAYENALTASGGVTTDYADGTVRKYTCQTCHMAPVLGQGCNKNPPVRTDLPRHDLNGGNAWMLDVLEYLDAQGQLLLGGAYTPEDLAAMADGKVRAVETLARAARLAVDGDTVRVVNLTGHKLISGYPEGRRMWLDIRWYDSAGTLLREDGAYGALEVVLDGVPTTVDTLLDLGGTNTRIYEAHGGITQEWAQQLLDLGYAANRPVEYDRVTGAVLTTLGDVAAQAPGTAHETYHFVLNNTVLHDNRIPPYGMAYDAAQERNCLPVPEDQYGAPGAGGTYQYWDTVDLVPPTGATYATIDLLYQPTSWEYIQFLSLENDGSVAFLANEGQKLLDAWLATGMAAPTVMASATWGTEPTNTIVVPDVTGWMQTDAEAAIVAAGLAVGTVDTAYHDTAPAGTAFVQDPLGGATVPQGTTIDLLVSLGPAPTGGVAIVAALETWALTKSGDPIAPATVFAGGDKIGVLATVVDASAAPIEGAVVTIEVVHEASGTVEHATEGTTASDGAVLVFWNSKKNSAAGAYFARVVAVDAPGSVFDPDAGVLTAGFTVQ